MDNLEYYYYDKRYKKKKELFDEYLYRIKIRFLSFLLSKKSLRKHLHSIDKFYEFKNKDAVNVAKNLFINDKFSTSENYNYKSLKLTDISFFEAVEIDKFDLFRKKFIAEFSLKHSGIRSGFQKKDELIEKLSTVKTDLNTTSLGSLISLDFKNSRTKSSDLIDYLNISYVKTRESYFILQIRITTSEKFNDIANKIFLSKDKSLSVEHLNSVKNILKYRLFTGHTSLNFSLTKENINNLISDLQYQVNYNVLRKLQGVLYFTSNNLPLPIIEHYTIKNFIKKKENKSLNNIFNLSHLTKFTIDNELLDLYIDENKQKWVIIKEDSYNKKDYESFEEFLLLRSSTFPFVFDAILNSNFHRLNHIKRKMYDFFENSYKWNPLKVFLIFKQNQKYFNLKKEITKLNLITSRYKNEINFHTLNFLINDQSESIENFNLKYIPRDNTEKSLSFFEYFYNEFKEKVELLNSRKDEINNMFINIEDLNRYRTNYILQIVSMLIAVMAFIFAFDKIKDFFLKIINMIF